MCLNNYKFNACLYMLKNVLLGVFIICYSSCSKTERYVTYDLSNNDKNFVSKSLYDWNVYGTFSLAEDSLIADSIIVNPCNYFDKHKSDSLRPYSYTGLYHPKFNQLDLREVYGIAPNDTLDFMNGRITYLYCRILSDADKQMFVEVNSSMRLLQVLNGDTLYRCDIQGPNIYPINLKKGYNDYVVKTMITGGDYAFEAILHDSISITRLYADCQTCNIIYPQIDTTSHVVMLSNAHQNVLDIPITLRFDDIYGNRICDDVVLKPGTFTYYIPGMQNQHSYMCSMTIGEHTVRQPVLCGRDDYAYARFVSMRASIPDSHPRANEIDQLLFRLNFLLKHPTRYDGDWWWQFKISPITYQLEHAFSHLNDTYGDDDSEASIQFVTYVSEQDDSLQRYLLARPNRIYNDKPLPLVVVIRPNIEKKYHFFVCPQLARQWALNQMQALSDRYGFLVMMPEIRTYLNEDLTPFAEQELKLAIKDVQNHYPVDTSRIFLHANCSAGYRALQMATDNPDMFRAIALYAPVYHKNYCDESSKERMPEFSIYKLKDVPLMVHGDPIDKHSPYALYKDLIKDCRKYEIPLSFSMKRNSEKFYNIVLVGEDALKFFKDVCGDGR